MVIELEFPDGKKESFDREIRGEEILETLPGSVRRKAIGCVVGERILDLRTPIRESGRIRVFTVKDPESIELLRHSCAHVMAQAVKRLYPDTRFGIGPTIENGFYYDMDCPVPLSEDIYPKIEAEMKKIIDEDLGVVRREVTKEEAEQIFAGDPYKRELISELPPGEISVYTQGEFTDLCRGPHLPRTGMIKAFKILKTAGAYWRGKADQPQLQRLYATAFFKKPELDQYLHQLEEAKKRDHRVIGKKLGLFHIDDSVGQGLILWKPAGAVVRQQLMDFISEELRRQGYNQVFTPHIGKLELYRTSGHFPYYIDSQFPPLIEKDCLDALADEGCSCAELSYRLTQGEIEGYLLKPMNCPHHIKIFQSEPRSYRDLPIRLAEFGTVYRFEQSGEISGMTRVRGFTQDDAHIFCREEQVEDEIKGCLELVKIVFNSLGMTDYRVRVGLRDPDSAKYTGESENWDKAEAACIEAARSLGVEFSEEAGEAAFYGPKIDFVVKDVLGREWQLGTVQVDYNLPRRFELSYIGSDNESHYPVMIHRAPFGSMERFVGVLTEHFAGAFPLWLSPVQAKILTITDRADEWGEEVYQRLFANGIRVERDFRNEKIGFKIRQAQLEKVPYMIVLGDKEVEACNLTVRVRTGRSRHDVSLEEFIEDILSKISEKMLDL